MGRRIYEYYRPDFQPPVHVSVSGFPESVMVRPGERLIIEVVPVPGMPGVSMVSATWEGSDAEADAPAIVEEKTP